MTHPGLFVIGILLEGLAILVFAAPDYVPGLRRVATWLAPRLRALERRARDIVRRILRRPPVPVVHHASAGMTVVGGLSARGVHGVSSAATLEEKVEFLLRRAEITQEVTDQLSDRITEVSSEAEQSLAAFRVESRAHLASELKAADEADRPLRLMGALLLAAGLACQSIASLL